MNPTVEILNHRKSIRSYVQQPLTDLEKSTILNAAMRAPTAGNMMLYSIIEIDDPSIKEHLAETCDHQPFIAEAPFLLLFAADYQRWFDYYCMCRAEEYCQQQGTALRTPAEGDLLLACEDALIAAQSAVIAAESLGIGSCYIGDILENIEDHRTLLNLPRYVAPVSLVCFGHPTPAQIERKLTPRFNQEYIIHKNTYHQLDETDLRIMMQTREKPFLMGPAREDGITSFGLANYVYKFSAGFSIEMTRSVQEIIRTWCGTDKQEKPDA